jgi:selenocysteine lyase/cysteine desulfurase
MLTYADRYLGNLEEREEAGTPDIVGAIRCGLVMRLKEAVGVASIMAREHAYWQMAKDAWGEHPAIHLLGNTAFIALQYRLHSA